MSLDTVRVLEQAERLPAETIIRDAVAASWAQVTDLHLSVAKTVAETLEEGWWGCFGYGSVVERRWAGWGGEEAGVRDRGGAAAREVECTSAYPYKSD